MAQKIRKWMKLVQEGEYNMAMYESFNKSPLSTRKPVQSYEYVFQVG